MTTTLQYYNQVVDADLRAGVDKLSPARAGRILLPRCGGGRRPAFLIVPGSVRENARASWTADSGDQTKGVSGASDGGEGLPPVSAQENGIDPRSPRGAMVIDDQLARRNTSATSFSMPVNTSAGPLPVM